MSSEPCRYDYAVWRLVPRVEREEFINIGVILFARPRDYLDCRVLQGESLVRRAHLLAPALDLEPVQRTLAGLIAICRGESGAGPIAQLSASERFHWLTNPRSTLLQPSTVHGGSTRDPAKDLERLFESLASEG